MYSLQADENNFNSQTLFIRQSLYSFSKNLFGFFTAGAENAVLQVFRRINFNFGVCREFSQLAVTYCFQQFLRLTVVIKIVVQILDFVLYGDVGFYKADRNGASG